MSSEVRGVTLRPANFPSVQYFGFLWNGRTVVVLFGLGLTVSIGVWIYRYFQYDHASPVELPPAVLQESEGCRLELGVFQEYPRDVLGKIASFLPERDLVSLGLCSTRLAKICSEDSLWKPISIKLPLPPKEGEMTYQKQVNQFYHRFRQVIFLISHLPRESILAWNPRDCYEMHIKSFGQRKTTIAIETALDHKFFDVVFRFSQIFLRYPAPPWIYRRAVAHRQWYLAYKILEKQPELINHIRDEVILFACEDNKIDLVESILQQGPISKSSLENCVSKATELGHLDMVKLLLSKNEPLGVHCREAAYQTAAIARRLDIMKVLEDNSIRKWLHLLVASYAHVQGYDEIVAYLGSQDDISEDDLRMAVSAACGFGTKGCEKELVQLLLQKGEITEESRRDCMCSAVRAGLEDVIGILLNNGRISEESRTLVLNDAIDCGHLGIVNLLLQDGPIDKRSRGIAFEKAAKARRLDIMKAVDDKSIPAWQRFLVASYAHIQGYNEITEYLGLQGNISEEDVVQAISSICKGVSPIGFNKEVVQLLLQKGRLTEDVRGSCVFEAIRLVMEEHPKLEVIDSLLADGPISEEMRILSLKLAVIRGYSGVVNRLLQLGGISEDVCRDSLLDAVLQEREEVVAALLEKNMISVQTCIMALDLAVSRGRHGITNLLLLNNKISVFRALISGNLYFAWAMFRTRFTKMIWS